jgi:hypothetical protein
LASRHLIIAYRNPYDIQNFGHLFRSEADMGGLIKFFTGLISGILGGVVGFIGGLVGGKKGGYYLDAGPAGAASQTVASQTAAVAPAKAAAVKAAAPAAVATAAPVEKGAEQAKPSRAAQLEALKDKQAGPGKKAEKKTSKKDAKAAGKTEAAAPMDAAALIAAAMTVNAAPEVALPVAFATKYTVPTIVPRRRPGANMTGYLSMAKDIRGGSKI